MKKKFILIFVSIFSTLLFGQEKVKIKFEITTPKLDDSTKIFVAGNIEPLGFWRPDKIQMKKISSDKWVYEFIANKNEQIEFKFTKGSWQTEALGNDLTIPRNNILIPTKDTIFTKTILNWRDKFDFKVDGQVTGKVDYYKNFVIDGLRSRNFFVWLPPNYENEKSKRYPVFYMHDGQNLIDPRTSNTFIDWRVDEVADSLIRTNEIEPFILVGINNTDDRANEYNNTELGKLYMKLIVEKIKPFVDKNYRTLTDAKNTAVGGSSMGGLISMICAWEYPNVFYKAACFSPAFKINSIDYVRVVKNYNEPKKDLLIYIDNGGKGLEAFLQPGVDSMIEALNQKGYEENKDYFVFIDEQAEHNEAAWAKRIWRPLKFFFGKK
ncbi:MAG: alpha/beta hydrolase-fold protein [Melioribacteraceae bacterium]|nr:alpha/beta hydrolase-fold protein [Melioribacteraceae bacterium]